MAILIIGPAAIQCNPTLKDCFVTGLGKGGEVKKYWKNPKMIDLHGSNVKIELTQLGGPLVLFEYPKGIACSENSNFVSCVPYQNKRQIR